MGGMGQQEVVVEGEDDRTRRELPDLLDQEQPVLDVGGHDADVAEALPCDRLEEIREGQVLRRHRQRAEVRDQRLGLLLLPTLAVEVQRRLPRHDLVLADRHLAAVRGVGFIVLPGVPDVRDPAGEANQCDVSPPLLERSLPVAGVALRQQGRAPEVPPHLVAEKVEAGLLLGEVGSQGATERNLWQGREAGLQPATGRRAGCHPKAERDGGRREAWRLGFGRPPHQGKLQGRSGAGEGQTQDLDLRRRGNLLEARDDLERIAERLLVEPGLWRLADQEDDRQMRPFPKQQDSRCSTIERVRALTTGFLGTAPREPGAVGKVTDLSEPLLDGVEGQVEAQGLPGFQRVGDQRDHELQVVVCRRDRLGDVFDADRTVLGG